jgi:hypothetical protein
VEAFIGCDRSRHRFGSHPALPLSVKLSQHGSCRRTIEDTTDIVRLASSHLSPPRDASITVYIRSKAIDVCFSSVFGIVRLRCFLSEAQTLQFGGMETSKSRRPRLQHAGHGIAL